MARYRKLSVDEAEAEAMREGVEIVIVDEQIVAIAFDNFRIAADLNEKGQLILYTQE